MSVGRHKRRQLCGRHLRSICSILTRCRIVLGFPRRYEISQVGCQDGSWSHRNAASCISGCDGALNVQPLSLISSEYDKVYLKPTARHTAGKSFDLVITRNGDGLSTPRNCSRVVCECVGVSTCEGAKKAAVQPWSSLVFFIRVHGSGHSCIVLLRCIITPTPPTLPGCMRFQPTQSDESIFLHLPADGYILLPCLPSSLRTTVQNLNGSIALFSNLYYEIIVEYRSSLLTQNLRACHDWFSEMQTRCGMVVAARGRLTCAASVRELLVFVHSQLLNSST